MSDRRNGWIQWLVPALAIVVAGAFAYLNSGERVAVHLGLFVLFRVPLTALVFVTFLLGMIAMFLIGLRHDLRVRRLLRQYQVQEERRPWRPEPLEPEPVRGQSEPTEPYPPESARTEPHRPESTRTEPYRPEPSRPDPPPELPM